MSDMKKKEYFKVRKWEKAVLPFYLFTFLPLFTACEQSLPVYDYADDALNFEQTLNSETGEVMERVYSFVYEGDEVTQDTVWVRVDTQGFVCDYDRPFRLQQIASDTDRPDATPGIHYVGFDDASLASLYVIPAGQNNLLLPVVVKRDASLKSEDVALYFQLQENEYFKQGLSERRTVMLVVSDRLSRPASWSDYYFGRYGQVKHRFMIDHTGLRWDEDFVSQLVGGEYGYIRYLMMLLARELETENAARAKQGLRPLTEENGDEVSFSWGASF